MEFFVDFKAILAVAVHSLGKLCICERVRKAGPKWTPIAARDVYQAVSLFCVPCTPLSLCVLKGAALGSEIGLMLVSSRKLDRSGECYLVELDRV